MKYQSVEHVDSTRTLEVSARVIAYVGGHALAAGFSKAFGSFSNLRSPPAHYHPNETLTRSHGMWKYVNEFRSTN